MLRLTALARAGILFVAVVPVLVATLWPSGMPGVEEVSCIVCGTHGIADAIRNVLLFVPTGAALTLFSPKWLRPVALGLMLSTGIEALQLTVVPGRDPSIGDVLFNTAGAAVGGALAHGMRAWVLPTARMAGPLAALATLAHVLVPLSATWLMQPDAAGDEAFALRTPRLGHLEHYRGQVREAVLGTIDLGEWRLRESPRDLLSLLADGAPLRIDARVGPVPRRIAPLLVIHNEAHQEVVLVGVIGDDLVFRWRAQAARVQLDQPDIRWRGALASLQPGDPLQVSIVGGAAWCATVNGVSRCAAVPAARSWAFVMLPERASLAQRRTLDLLWLLALGLPLGLWCHGRRGLAVMGLVASGWILVPAGGWLAPLAIGDWLALAGGVLMGLATRRAVRSVLEDRVDEGRQS